MQNKPYSFKGVVIIALTLYLAFGRRQAAGGAKLKAQSMGHD